ncbi:YegP family protein [Arthrobacter sp. NPDC058130]|uniref:YegP family protein n=1 Tax=Arthrobacter sp. NPDC058130 TaxID=3346353 RepID=UPI0036E548D4
MAGLFELFLDAHSRYRFQLKAPDGTVMAVSKAFEDKPSAVSGIGQVRDYAGTGLVRDLSAGEPPTSG